MNSTFLIVIGAAIILVLLVRYLKEKERKKRIESLKEIADSIGFTFISKVGSGFLDKIRDFYLYTREGSNPEVKNLMTGRKNGFQVSVFDYHYTIGDQKVSTRYGQSILLIESRGLDLPLFILRPESFLDKIGSLFGGQDIDFQSNPKFSDHYLLRGEDEGRIRETFSEVVISYYGQNHGMYTEGNSDRLIFFREMGKDFIRPEKIPDLMANGLEACRVFLQRDTSTVA